ncbi:MAG: rhodanese-like domain-containing protein [Campylobacterota bacterium]|nr:rhodanese-like domain-containing protein [Campylobacterota bacterium]
MNKFLKTLCVLVGLSVAPLMASDNYSDKNILISADKAIKLIGNPKVMFVSGDSSDVYKLGHIKGSVEMYAHHLHHADIMGDMHCAPLFRCLDDAEHYIGSKGISNDTMIIAYDDYKGPNATGVYAFFTSYGHKNIKILNGGRAAIMAIDPAQKKFDAIAKEFKKERRVSRKAKKQLKLAKAGEIALDDKQIADFKAKMKDSKAKQKKIKARLKDAEKSLLVVKGEESVKAKTYKINKKNLDFKHIAGVDEVEVAMKDIVAKGADSKFVIVDTRSMNEIVGGRQMDHVARGGHVPGATLLEWNKISDLDKKLSFKPAADLKKVFKKYDITPDKTVYAYCQVGAGRSSEIIVALQLLGYPNVKVFTGSWDVWGNSLSLPIKQ